MAFGKVKENSSVKPEETEALWGGVWIAFNLRNSRKKQSANQSNTRRLWDKKKPRHCICDDLTDIDKHHTDNIPSEAKVLQIGPS